MNYKNLENLNVNYKQFMAKQIKFNEDARASIKKGIDKLAQAVTMTLVPAAVRSLLKRATARRR